VERILDLGPLGLAASRRNTQVKLGVACERILERGLPKVVAS